MARSTAEYAFGRVLAYLRWYGVPMTPATTRQALSIVEQALSDGDVGLIKRVMEALPHHFVMPELRFPPAALPINRASLGYAPYL
jgi:hypothetical protein